MPTKPRLNSPRPIRQLPPSVINKIAAGEVIERPASVVKELLENSIDAGATQIEVAVENGGLDLIRITDNGCGIECDDLVLAVTSHATSKIQDAEDLFQVGTFGFRGEALASIAEISEFTIRTKTADQESAYELRVTGGKASSVEPIGAPVGTTILVENIFFNTPVRRKFMRTAQTEFGHISEAFARIAMANPECHLTLLHNRKVQYQLAPTDDWSVRINDFFGPEIGEALILITSSEGPISLQGYVVDPRVTRSHNRMQYLFLNGRYIRDRSLQHALTEAYRGLVMTGRFPICFLRLDMPYEMVDVNVHPAKLEVRFQDGGRIYSQLLGTLRNKFLTTDLTAKGDLGRGPMDGTSSTMGLVPPPLPYPDAPGRSGNPYQLQPSVPETQSRLDFPSGPQRNWIDAPAGGAARGGSAVGSRWEPPGGGQAQVPAPSTVEHSQAQTNFPGGESSVPQQHFPNPSHAAPPGPHRPLAIQVHNTYLITETDEGLVIIDQHALHERVLYEQLRERVTGGRMEAQRLLVPEPVRLRPAEVAAVLERSEALAQLGIEVEPFGGDTVLVVAYPAMLANHSPAEMLRGIIDKLMTEGSTLTPQDLIDELLHMMACKAAIKAGDQLSRDEIEDLIAFRDFCRDAHHCPHGRPTALVFSREELDKKFKRI
ncbi:MAG: DNA mismatch repair endonuclease MutL [Pirellulaceae bacterium]|nr:DNA mismatch repair endonuclease MutL [Pirellulaceae bacterium]